MELKNDFVNVKKVISWGFELFFLNGAGQCMIWTLAYKILLTPCMKHLYQPLRCLICLLC